MSAATVSVTFIDPQGGNRTVDAPVGWSVMEAAVQNDVHGVVGECGGACACATCHVRIDDVWLDRLPPVTDTERDMLECTAEPATPASRLGCQIPLRAELSGLVVHTPSTQI